MKPLIRAVGHVYSPWLNECFTKRYCPERGVEFELLDRALRILGYDNITYIKAESIISRIEMLRNGSADISVNEDEVNVAMQVQKDSLVMSSTICHDKLVYWVKDATGTNSSVVFSVCDWKVWLLLAVLVITVITLRLVYKLNGETEKSGFHISNYSTKGTNYVWWLVLGIFLGVYANLLAIALSIPTKAPLPFKDLEDLSYKLKSGKCHIVVAGSETNIIPGYGVLSTVVPSYESNVPPAIQKTLLEAYSTNPAKLVGTHDEMMQDIRSKECHIGIDYYQGSLIYEAKYCGVKWIKDAYSPKKPFVILYRKELASTLGNDLKTLLTIGSSDDVYSNTAIRLAKRHTKACMTKNTVRPVVLGQLSEIFFLLFSAGIGGIILCMKEKLLFKREKNIRKQKRQGP